MPCAQACPILWSITSDAFILVRGVFIPLDVQKILVVVHFFGAKKLSEDEEKFSSSPKCLLEMR